MKKFVDTNPGDAGGAVGSAFSFLNKNGSKISKNQKSKFLGPSFSNEEIEKTIIEKIKHDQSFSCKYFENLDELHLKLLKLFTIKI